MFPMCLRMWDRLLPASHAPPLWTAQPGNWVRRSAVRASRGVQVADDHVVQETSCSPRAAEGAADEVRVHVEQRDLGQGLFQVVGEVLVCSSAATSLEIHPRLSITQAFQPPSHLARVLAEHQRAGDDPVGPGGVDERDALPADAAVDLDLGLQAAPGDDRLRARRILSGTDASIDAPLIPIAVPTIVTRSSRPSTGRAAQGPP